MQSTGQPSRVRRAEPVVGRQRTTSRRDDIGGRRSRPTQQAREDLAALDSASAASVGDETGVLDQVVPNFGCWNHVARRRGCSSNYNNGRRNVNNEWIAGDESDHAMLTSASARRSKLLDNINRAVHFIIIVHTVTMSLMAENIVTRFGVFIESWFAQKV